MTGEWETIIPDVFDPKKRKLLAKEKQENIARLEKRAAKGKKPQKNLTEQPSSDTKNALKERLKKTTNNFQKTINTEIKPTISNAFYENTEKKHYQDKTHAEEKLFSSPSTTNNVSTAQKGIKKK